MRGRRRRSQQKENSSDEEEEAVEAPEAAARPQGLTPPFSAEAAHECQGSITEANMATLYQTGPPATEIGVIVVGDFWGWNGGRLRAIADYLASVLNACVVIPRLYAKPPFGEGTDGDGLPPDFDVRAQQAELRGWLLKYLWETFQPRVQATANFLRSKGAKRIAGVGFCIGAWVISHVASIVGEYVCSVMVSPSIHLIQELNGVPNEALARKIQTPALFLRANDDPAAYAEGGEVLEVVKQKVGEDAESMLFPRATHNWVTRGDASDPQVREDVERAVLLAAKFLRKFLWPHPRGADAGSLRLRAQEGDEVSVKQLLDNGVPAGGRESVDELRQTPLHYAARAGQMQPVKLLAEYAADVNVHGGVGLETPLHVAAGLNHVKVVRTLLVLAADVHVEDKAGQRPLHYAAKAGALPCVKMLVEARADMRAKDTSEQTPLHLAAFFGREQVVTSLLRARMDVEPLDLRVHSPAERASQQGFHSLAQALERERLRREEEEFHKKNPVPAMQKSLAKP